MQVIGTPAYTCCQQVNKNSEVGRVDEERPSTQRTLMLEEEEEAAWGRMGPYLPT